MANLLVERMPDRVRNALKVAGSVVRLGMGDRLPEDDLRGRHVFIMERGVVSSAIRSASGQFVDIGVIGPEGIFPFAGLLKVPSRSDSAIAQVDDVMVRRVSQRDFHDILQRCPDCWHLLNCWMYAYMIQVYSTMAAAREADMVTQVARWLLMCHDRLEGDELSITHEMLAQLCNTYRPTVTNALANLKSDNAIDTGRGRITILSRDVLFERAHSHYGHFESYWCDNIGPFGKACGQTAGNSEIVLPPAANQ